MRTLLPALLTLPSNTVDTFSCLPILRMFSVLPLKTKTDVLAGTRNPLIWYKAVHKSSAIARAESYRGVGSFSRHFRQIVERSRSIFGFQSRGCRGSVSSTNLIVSYVVPPAKGGWPVSNW